ncbi:MAG: hypothetical protein DA408_02180 [Bacteroidetes bacterium]|nr:MAG: hypothetical protein C7N36_00865 [Bacteroidota bacterium]PTM14621.1 MAG: hypothetical protein DA408_02180 [Bacteroidota bacterium]
MHRLYFVADRLEVEQELNSLRANILSKKQIHYIGYLYLCGIHHPLNFKHMYKCLIVVFCLLNAGTTFAQQAYIWDEYGLAFTVADDFVEVVNNSDEFSMVGDGMEMTIIPFIDETISNDDIAVVTMEIAAALGLDRIDDISVIMLNGFRGGYAEGVLNNEKIFLMGLIDPQSYTNFFVIITFLDDDQNAIDEAVNICLSFQKL